MRQSLSNTNKFNSFSWRTEYFKNSFFASIIGKWKKLDTGAYILEVTIEVY